MMMPVSGCRFFNSFMSANPYPVRQNEFMAKMMRPRLISKEQAKEQSKYLFYLNKKIDLFQLFCYKP
jgi:hypothetical protein